MRQSLLLCIFTAALVGACGGSTTSLPATGTSDAGDTGGTTGQPEAGTDATVPPSLEGMAFDIEIPLPDSGYPWCAGDCTPASVLVTHADDSTVEVVWGAKGRAFPLTLSPSPAGWQFDGTLLLGSVLTWDHAMCTDESNLGPATFDFSDHDHDGKVDLVITGHQFSKHCSDDYSTTSEGDVTLTGVPDVRKPVAVGPSGALMPLHGLSIELDKPLDSTASCSVQPSGGGAALPLEPQLMNGYVVGFETPQILPLGASYTAQFYGADFAGIGTPAPITFSTVDDFGVLAQDGFESGSTAGISGATVVESYAVPALSGQRMLLVDPGQSVMLHLHKSGGEQNLVMDVRKFDACWGMGWDGPFELRVGVVGADTIESGSISMGSNPETISLEGGSISMGELQTVTVPLTGSGDDVLVYMRGDSYQGAGCSRVGALLDNVKLQ